jgi:hypothetical protein
MNKPGSGMNRRNFATSQAEPDWSGGGGRTKISVFNYLKRIAWSD